MNIILKPFKAPLQLRTVVSMAMGGISLIVLVIAFQLNSTQRQLLTQVLRVNEQGVEEQMSFKEYREQYQEQVSKLLSDCLERNEFFGDGTGEECEIYREQLFCVKESMNQENLLDCL